MGSFLNWFKTSPAKDGYKITPSYDPWDPPTSTANAKDMGAASAGQSLDSAIQAKGGSNRAQQLAPYYLSLDALGAGPRDIQQGLLDEQGEKRPGAKSMNLYDLPEPAQEAYRDAAFAARDAVLDTDIDGPVTDPPSNVRAFSQVDGRILTSVRKAAKGVRKGLPW